MNSSQLNLNVFVYGTLKPGESNYQHYCETKVRSETEAYTWGDLYNLPLGYPAMVEGINKVKGTLLIFDDENILQDLDRLEGYQEHQETIRNEYYRQLVSVYDFDDKPLEKAWTYFMTKNKVEKYGGILLSSGIWSGLVGN